MWNAFWMQCCRTSKSLIDRDKTDRNWEHTENKQNLKYKKKINLKMTFEKI